MIAKLFKRVDRRIFLFLLVAFVALGIVAPRHAVATGVTVTGLQGRPVATTAPSSNQFLQWGGSSWGPITLGGDLSVSAGTGSVVGLGNGVWTITSGWAGSTNSQVKKVTRAAQLLRTTSTSTANFAVYTNNSATSVAYLKADWLCNNITTPGNAGSGTILVVLRGGANSAANMGGTPVFIGTDCYTGVGASWSSNQWSVGVNPVSSNTIDWEFDYTVVEE